MARENLLSVRCEVVDEIGHMELEGELLAELRFEPERVLRDWLETGVSKVIIQFDKLTNIDSAGLSTLLGALHRYRRHNGDLVLAHMDPTLNAIFEITSMEKYFKIFPDIAAARAHFRQSAKPKTKTRKAPDRAKTPPPAKKARE